MRKSTYVVSSVLLWAAVVSSHAQTPQQRAGDVTALLPVAYIERGAAARAQARLNDPLFWRDWFETEAQGRARLALLDGSLVNVGSAARLQVLEHDQATERTELELRFGKVRAEVKQRTRPDGRFTVRTDSAVVGVIGTHVYVAAAALTTVINFEGRVRVSNADASVAGDEMLEPFELAEIEPGRPPRKRLATLQELLQALRDTLPGLPVAGAPERARAGSCASASLGEALTGPVDPTSAPLEILPRGCGGPDITPVRMCVPPSAPPGVHEYAMRAADGELRWAALLVEPPAPYEGARILVAPELPPGATHHARLVGRDNQPLAGVPVRIRRGAEEQTLTTDENGAFIVQAPASGTVELTVTRAGAEAKNSAAGKPQPPLGPAEPIVATINVVEKLEANSDLPDYGQRGGLLTLPGEVEGAHLGATALPVLRTITSTGKTISSIFVPADLAEGPGQLELEEPGGKRRRQPLFVYEVLGGRLDQATLSSGGVTDGEFLVCVGAPGDKPRKVRARITAAGPVHFRGQGGKGKSFERSFAVESSGLLRIPFQIQAEKGSPTGIPFALYLILSGD